MMVTIEEALKIIKDQKVTLKTEVRSLSECLGFSISERYNSPI